MNESQSSYNRIVVVLEDGLVTMVCSTDPTVDVAVIDRDVFERDPGEYECTEDDDFGELVEKETQGMKPVL